MVPIEDWLAQAGEFRRKHGRPLVTLSYAQSLDGSISARPGVRTRLSGPESLRLTHRLRSAHDAILVGIGTILADDPRLTVRLAPGENPQPVVLDGRLRIPLNARLLQGEMPPWIAVSQPYLTQNAGEVSLQEKIEQLQSRRARLIPLPVERDGCLSLPALLSELAELGVASLMVEGGARVITSFLARRLVDQVVLTIAPLFLAGFPAIQGLPHLPPHPQQIQSGDPAPLLPRLREIGYDQMGEDLIVWGKLYYA